MKMFKVLLVLVASSAVLAAQYADAQARGRPRAHHYWFGKTDSGIATSATSNFYSVNMPESGDASTAEAQRQTPQPAPGCASELKVRLGADIGTAGDNLTVTLRKNTADTRLTCTISGGTGTEARCENLTDEPCWVAGDLLALAFVTAGSPDATVLPAWSMRVEPAEPDRVSLLATSGSLTINTSRSFALGHSTMQADPNTVMLPMPTAGRVTRMYARASGSVASGNRVVCLEKNGVVGTDLCCTLNAGAQQCTDAGDTYFPEGSFISWNTISGDAATTALTHSVGFLFQPDTPGEWPIFAGGAAPSTAAVNYLALPGSPLSTASATEETVAGWMRPIQLLRMIAFAPTVPGGSASWRVDLRQSLLRTTAMGCTIGAAATGCRQDSAMQNVDDLDRISIATTPSGTPAASSVRVGIAARAW